MLTVIEKVIVLQNVDIFADVPTEQLSSLAAIAKEVAFSKDEVIFRVDDPSDSLYVVLDGKIRLHQNEQEISLAGANDVFGTWALFDNEPRVVTATVVEDARLLYIDHDDFIELISDNIRITQGIFKRLVGKLRGLAEHVARK